MSHSIRSFLGLGATFTALLPLLASAQPAPRIETPDQVRAIFTDAGFQVDAPHTWWTNGSTTFLVHDSTSPADPTGRVVMVLVYADLETAQAERQRAAAADEADAIDGFAPRMVPGYGPSTWHANVAMVESTKIELNRLYQAQLETDVGIAPASGVSQWAPAALPTIAATTLVDADFVTAFEQGLPTVNL